MSNEFTVHNPTYQNVKQTTRTQFCIDIKVLFEETINSEQEGEIAEGHNLHCF